MIQYDQWYFVSSIPLFCELMHVCYAYLESSTQTISILLDFYLFCNPMMSLKRIFLQTRNWNIFTLNLKYIYIHIYTWWICWERIILYIYIYIYIIVSQQIHRVDAIDRENLLMRHPKQNNIETLTLILTYHPALKMFMRYSAKHIVILWSHQDCNMFYQHHQELLSEMINHWKINLLDQN